MSTPEPTPVALLDRVEHLERANQRLFGIVVLLVLVAFLQTSWHFLPMPGKVVAESFVLKPRNGAVRGQWSTWADGTPVFRLNDEKGQARALFALRHDGTLSLRMSDRHFTTRLEMLVDPDGSPRVALYGSDGHSRANLLLDTQEQGMMDLRRH
jgi:hypothetical protein